MKASEAKKIAQATKTGQYESIIESILNQARQGKLEMWYYNNPIEQVARDMLTKDGYVVGKTQFDRNDTLTRISWE